MRQAPVLADIPAVSPTALASLPSGSVDSGEKFAGLLSQAISTTSTTGASSQWLSRLGAQLAASSSANPTATPPTDPGTIDPTTVPAGQAFDQWFAKIDAALVKTLAEGHSVTANVVTTPDPSFESLALHLSQALGDPASQPDGDLPTDDDSADPPAGGLGALTSTSLLSIGLPTTSPAPLANLSPGPTKPTGSTAAFSAAALRNLASIDGSPTNNQRSLAGVGIGSNLPTLTGLGNLSAGKLPLSLLPPEVREAAARILGERGTRYNEQGAQPVIHPSLLSNQELANADSSVTDRNAAVLARSDRAEFVNRVADALEKAVGQSPRRIEVELSPPSLGKLRIQVIKEDGQMTARIEATSSAARSMIVEQLSSLDRHLEQQGLTLARLVVDEAPSPSTTPSSTSLMPGLSGEMFGNGQQSPFWREPSRDRAPERGPEDDPNRETEPLTMQGLFRLANGMNRLI